MEALLSFSFVVHCPTCKGSKEVSRVNLRRRGAWNSVKCSRCEHLHKASRWLCCCIKPWIGCSVHFQEGLKCSNPKEPRSTAAKRSPEAELEAKQKMRKTVGQLGEKALDEAKSREQKLLVQSLRRACALAEKARQGACRRRPVKKNRSLKTANVCSTSDRQTWLAGSQVVRRLLREGKIDPAVIKK